LATLTGAAATALRREPAAAAKSRHWTPIRGLMASVFSLASIASCESAPTDSRVAVMGPTERALNGRSGAPPGPETLVAGDAAFGRSASISVARSFHFVMSRAFLFAGDRSGVVARVRRPLRTIVGDASMLAATDPPTPKASHLLAEGAIF